MYLTGVNNNKWHDLNLTLDAAIPDIRLTLDGSLMTSLALQEGWWPHTGVNTNSFKVNVTFGGRSLSECFDLVVILVFMSTKLNMVCYIRAGKGFLCVYYV